jgi:coenzyme F420 hydrogenase subunit beta
MGTSPPGYGRPIQNRPVDEVAERRIAAACPGAVVAPWPSDVAAHPVWGPWRSVGTGFATDEALRRRASSGGAISALAIHALKSGVVDRVVHVIADPVHPTRNIMTCSTTAAEVEEGAGSRYSASAPLEVIDQVLSDGGKIAFIGKPCDVSAIRRLAEVDPRVDAHVKLLLSFFCAGIPSHDGAARVIAAMGLDPAEVSAFRYRGYGWPGNAVARTRDGRTAEMSYEESWGRHLSKEVQFRCKICPDAVGGAADIACADAWYGDDRGYPSFEEQDGRSLILARTATGEARLSAAVADGALAVQPLDIGEIDRMQPAQARRKRLVRSRVAALTATLQPKPDISGTKVGEAALRASPKEQISSLLGAVRRILIDRR